MSTYVCACSRLLARATMRSAVQRAGGFPFRLGRVGQSSGGDPGHSLGGAC